MPTIPLTEAAATVVAAALRTSWQIAEQDPTPLYVTVQEYLEDQYEEAARESGDVVPILPAAERAVLVARLRELDDTDRLMLWAAVATFWRETGEHAQFWETVGVHPPDTRQQLIAAGFRIVP